MKLRILILTILLVVATLTAVSPAEAARAPTFIRDAEIENTIRAYAAPLFTAAGVPPESIRVHLIQDKALNAFVAGGLQMFLNTGLLIRAEHAGQIIGVIAHETGHISGGHLSRTSEALSNAGASAILGAVLGTAAAVGTGRGDLGAAIMLGGQEMGKRQFLKYSRVQESSADQVAVKLLDATGQSARGLMEFMSILVDQELIPSSSQDPYVRTHPITQNRVDFLRNHVNKSVYSDVPISEDFQMRNARMKAKLIGFLTPPSQTLRQYPETDQSLPARYARSVAYYRRADTSLALREVDGLLADYPEDPYFHELKGQILFETGNVHAALPEYEAAVRLAPKTSLLLSLLAQTRLESGDPAQAKLAIEDLRTALRLEPESTHFWSQLGRAYALDGQMDMATLSQAEEAYLSDQKSEARFYAEKAAKLLPSNSSSWLRAQDILFATQPDKDEEAEGANK
ncbi:M48 family metalloprotease [Magnetospira thiophila]